MNKQSPILIAGCGDLGAALAGRLVASGYQVSGLRRSDSVLPDGVQGLRGDVTQPESLRNLAALRPEILVYCVSANAQTDDQYHAIYVQGLRHVLNALDQAKSLRHVFFVSSTRVYGQSSDALLREDDQAIATDFGGQRLLEGEALLKHLPCPGTALRLSGIYGPGRARMINLAKNPENWPLQNSWTNRIHRDDAAAFIAFLIAQVVANQVVANKTVEDCYIVTDSFPVAQYEVLLWLASQLNVDVNSVVVPPVSGGKRLSNARMLATGFKLRYESYQAGYGEMLSGQSVGG